MKVLSLFTYTHVVAFIYFSVERGPSYSDQRVSSKHIIKLVKYVIFSTQFFKIFEYPFKIQHILTPATDKKHELPWEMLSETNLVRKV